MVDGVVLDVDGTLIRGDTPIPGAVDALSRIRESGCSPLLISNNPIQTREAYCDRLTGHEFSLSPTELITAGTITAEFLAREHDTDTLFVVGEEGLREQLREAGLTLTTESERADVLVASIDREFTYEKLTHALWTLSDPEIGFVGTDPDRTIPTEGREVPGSGAIINAVSGVAGREPEAMMGKPSRTAIAAVERRLGLSPEQCLIVGDRLDTDIAMGERAGMITVLVQTGVTDEQALRESEIEPDYVLDSISEIDSVL
jgi:4-nitrophenyl phosphatase